ncbi:MAG: hypothetical protein ACD_2C00079G0010 [uncultured bacterium (gcode 4)]|uniref:Uncharacterized protein n=1 Tax=uncultured bacterium (gcode 4) TaxID=1234023 RepID=K2G3R1_9BACT|nr:MAG: hypothetical protein ACD_2C00079G0010 [uncultured bacterium (gcode 4)]
MSNVVIIIMTILGVIALYNAIVLYFLSSVQKKILHLESEIIESFFSKVNKIPAVVEIMRRYTRHPDIFEDIIYLHKMWIIYNIESIYDLLDLNQRIHREFQFLMKLSAKIPDLHRDGNFLYIRNYVIFFENQVERKIWEINVLLYTYNKFIKIKNISIFGFLVPIKKKLVIW